MQNTSKNKVPFKIWPPAFIQHVLNPDIYHFLPIYYCASSSGDLMRNAHSTSSSHLVNWVQKHIKKNFLFRASIINFQIQVFLSPLTVAWTAPISPVSARFRSLLSRCDLYHSASDSDQASTDISRRYRESPIKHNINLCCCYSSPSQGWRHGGRPWSSRSQETLQGLDQRLYRDRESPKSEQRKESVAGQCRMRWKVSWGECLQALHEQFSILPILKK